MFESITPEQHSYKEPRAETSPSRTAPEHPSQHPRPEAVIDEEIVLRQIEERAKRYPQELSFRHLEHTLDLALSDNALEAYKKAGYWLERDSDLPFLRLTDLEASLSLLQRFQDRLPNRYQANVEKVLDHADAVKQIFLDYRQLREKGLGRDVHDVAALLSAFNLLHKIDPARFPTDLVDVTNEERARDQDLRDLTLRKSEQSKF